MEPLYYRAFIQWDAGEIMGKFRIGDDIIIDSDGRSVRKNNIELNLPELTYRLLLILVENAPHTVSHDKLFEAVWQGRIVSDENLKKRISRLRLVLSDAVGSSSYIISERGMGYRFIAPVKILTETEIKPKENGKRKFLLLSPRFFKHRLLSLILLSIIGLSAFKITFLNSVAPPRSNVQKPKTTVEDYVYQAAQFYSQFRSADNTNAITLYKKAIDMAPNYSSAYAGLANALSQGYYQFGQGEDWLQQAIDLSMRSIEIDSKLPWGYESLGFALYLSGRFAESITAFKKASKIAPNWGEPISYSALVHLETGNLILAYRKALEAIQRDPSNPVTKAILSLCYRELGMFESARKMIEELLRLNPEYALAYNYLAGIGLATGNYPEAKISVINSLKLTPDNQSTLWIQSLLMLQSGTIESAVTSFKRTAQIGGRYRLPAKVYLALINKDEHRLEQLYRQLISKIDQGNRWYGLIYCKALISLAKDNITTALGEFQQAIDAGMSSGYHFKVSPLLLTIATNLKFTSLVDGLESKISQQRQKVIQIELLDQGI